MITSMFNRYRVNLIQSVEEMMQLKEKFSKSVIVGVDTETTGLNFLKDDTVGYCVSGGSDYSVNGYEGYYIPVRHLDERFNLPLNEVVAFMQYIMDNHKTIFWNRNFDFHFMERDGIVITPSQNYHDAQVMRYLSNQIRTPRLKDTAEELLKWTVIEYSENNAVGGSFATTDPRVSYIYASGDPLMTALLGKLIWTKFPDIRKIYPLDNKCLEAMRYFSTHVSIPIDYNIVDSEYERVQNRMSELRQSMFDLCGYVFSPTKKSDKIDALQRMGITFTDFTEKGDVELDKSVLKYIDHPLAQMMVEYTALDKFFGTYLKNLKSFRTQYPDGLRIDYKTTTVATGRFSCGASSGNPYYTPLNIQNQPKQEVFKYVHEDERLGYIVNMEKEGAIGRMKVKGGIRDAFIAPEGYVFLNADYAGQELRCMANLSNEPIFINCIREGHDLHTYVAKKMFGFEDKAHRTKVKILNFMIAYGASPYALSKTLNVPIEEAKELYANYFKTLSVFGKWREEVIRKSHKDFKVSTCFGRVRNLYQYYNSSSRKDRSFGERTALNSPIQGFGGDLIRKCHVELWYRFLSDKEFADNVIYHSTVHDEISLLVRPTYLKKAYDILKGIMYFHPKEFKVPMIAEPAVGTSWGTLCEATGITDDNKVILNLDKVEPL